MTEQDHITGEILNISSELAQRIQSELNQNVYLCYQCIKCTSGCPMVEYFDWQPNQIMRAIQLGQDNIALNSQTPWLCASCATCTTRCPQGLDINGIMEFLTREALRRGIKPLKPNVNIFNQAFLREIRIWGRAYEPGLMAEMKLRNPSTLLDDLDLYIKMLQKQKVGFFPSFGHPPHKAEPIADAANSIAYYPGCSLHSTAPEFNSSTLAVCDALEIPIIEPHNWVCCGSTPAHRADPEYALKLPMQNLALIEQSGFREVTMPCAACFNHHKYAQYEIRHNEKRKRDIDDTLEYTYKDTVYVSTLIEAIQKHVGTEKIKQLVKIPLVGLRVVCYYGCLLTRPPEITEVKHPENPTDMDELMTSLGAEVIDWSYKTTCCGATHSLTRPEVVLNLSGNIIRQAHQAGADVIAVACPLCHTNLDARQFQMGLDKALPVMYFTQLIALALGLLPKFAALHKNLIDPRPLLRTKGIITSD